MPLVAVTHNHYHEHGLEPLLIRLLANQEIQMGILQDIRDEGTRATTALNTIAGLLAGNVGGLNATDANEAKGIVTAIADQATTLATPPAV